MTEKLHTADEERDALLTAYALNQISGAEQASVKASLADDPAGQTYVEQTRRLAGIVEGALSSEASPAASAALRSEIDERLIVREVLAKPVPATALKRSWRREIIIGTVAGGLLAALLVPGVREGVSRRLASRDEVSDSRKTSVTKEMEEVRANLSNATSSRRSAKAMLRPRLEEAYTDAKGEIEEIGVEGEVVARNKRFIDRPASSDLDALSGLEYHESRVGVETVPSRLGARKPGADQSGGGKKGQGQSAAAGPYDQPGPAGGGEAESKLLGDTVATKAIKVRAPSPQDPQAAREYRYSDSAPRGLTVLSPQPAGTAPKYAPAEAAARPAPIQLATDTERSKQRVDERLSETARYHIVPTDGETAEQYDQIVENAFLPAKDNALSTFSIDVDTASYANTRRFLTGGQLPPPSAVRIEELINYFTYDDPQPAGNSPFSVNMELSECPWTPGHHLLRVGLKGREISKDKRPNSNLVFLLDVSGSMQTHNKLPLVKEAMKMLVRQLTENDMVTIVVYAGQEGLALDTTSGDQKDKILTAIDNLSAGGSTHASAGITLAYDKATQNFLKEGTNRVILCTDGDFNVGITDDESLVKLISDKAKSNVFLSVLGFGMGNLKDAKMEKLADKGNGNYGYIDTAKEAQKVLVEQMTGSLITIAKDVKIQIEFNPAAISSYRQIGYENRVLAAKDFNDDTKDAGEIGAGHSVTALYEVVLVGNEKTAAAAKEAGVPLKYQRPTAKPEEAKPATDRELTEAAQTGELCTVKLRFKEPTADKSELMEFPLKQEPKRFGAASENLRFASAVAAFGMVLRGSEHRGGASMSAVEEIASASLGKDPNSYRADFLELVRKAQQLGK